MSLDVLCIGHAAYDLLFYVEQFPSENSKSETALSQESGGGPAANAAYLLSLWGTRCAFAGVVGDDYFGQQILAEFKSVATNTSLLEVRSDLVTPLSFVLVSRKSGSRTLVNRKVPCSPLKLELESLAGLFPRILLFDGHELEASLSALAAFPNAISLLDAGSPREGTLALAGKVTHLVASERFALQVTALPNLASADLQRSCLDALRKRFNTTIVVTLGERGLIVSNGQGCQRLPAFPVAVADTTAAGDIFHGALAYGLLEEKPLLDNLRFASMAAALSVASPGGRQSIPSVERVKAALAHAE
jgi:sugar/nucleoside kinase (ribokinase family)